ncbi:L-threonylcarbamoyladenylate synthase [Anaeromicropila herbilytica]|nr:L-threonylcarbamoyladenylate synthase [Anaeromicropila herbilytica]
MNTIVKKINEDNFTDTDLCEAAKILREGGLVAFPTETVYGLGANGLDEKASKKIYEAKGRPSDNPLILHIADVDSLYEIASEVPESAKRLADEFWPGPLTMILKKNNKVPYSTTGGLESVAIRMPEHKIALALIKESGLYIAAPSANTSGKPSPTKAEHVIKDLNGKVDMIIDGGKVGIGLESTIIDLTSKVPTILRPGYITEEMLNNVLGTVDTDKAILKENKDKNYKPKAPGMKYKHYAPKANLTIFEGNEATVIDEIIKRTMEKQTQGVKVGIIATDESKEKYQCGVVKTIGSRKNNKSIARGLYEILRDFDDLDVDVIYSESFLDNNLGQAIMNRLLKASGYDLINVR